MKNSYQPSQIIRLAYLVIYLLIFFLISHILFGKILPPFSGKGFWFYTGLISFVLGSLLVTPFYTNPANALSYATAALIAMVFTIKNEQSVVYIIMVNYVAIIIILSLIAIVTNSSNKEVIKKISFSSNTIVQAFGNPRILYIFLIMYAVIEFHFNSPKEIILILFAGIITSLQLIERIHTESIKMINRWREKDQSEIIGNILAYQTPNIILIKLEQALNINNSPIFIANDPNFGLKLGLGLGYMGRDESVLLRILELDYSVSNNEQLVEYSKNIEKNEVIQLDKKKFSEVGATNDLVNKSKNFLGIVDIESSIDSINIEIINEKSISEGRLLEVNIQEGNVIYQILDGLTKEDIISQKNKYGYARAKARKIGKWDLGSNKFKQVKWLPNINTPVYLKEKEEITVPPESIGTFPETNYYVTINDFDSLVTHNTAILGVLGVGKSMFSIELVERLISNKIKVICIDLTNQYSNELKEFIDAKREGKRIIKIIEAGKKDSDSISDNPDEGGSYPNISKAFAEDIDEFIKSEYYFLKIYNPSQITGSKQLNEPKSYKEGDQWFRSAGLYSITPVEITQVITEVCLNILQDNMSDKARLCLVFEEAHSLIPEWNSVVYEGDKKAAMGTARAILQGRKYGLG